MAAVVKSFVMPEEYLDRERHADLKSEYLSGQMFAMADASEAHNTITLNMASELRGRFHGGPCRAFVNDMRVRVSPAGLYTYPDVVAVCGEREFADEHMDTLTNPTVIVEVLSPSTELYDRNEKFRHYETLESLTDYVLVAQDRVQVDHYARQGQRQWLLTRLTEASDSLEFPSISVEIPVAALYENVTLAPSADA